MHGRKRNHEKKKIKSHKTRRARGDRERYFGDKERKGGSQYWNSQIVTYSPNPCGLNISALKQKRRQEKKKPNGSSRQAEVGKSQANQKETLLPSILQPNFLIFRGNWGKLGGDQTKKDLKADKRGTVSLSELPELDGKLSSKTNPSRLLRNGKPNREAAYRPSPRCGTRWEKGTSTRSPAGAFLGG